jgi:hypothetical protein
VWEVRQHGICRINQHGHHITTPYKYLQHDDYIYLPATPDGQPPPGYFWELDQMKLVKKPKPGNGKCDAMRCKNAPAFRHQNQTDGTMIELCEKHSEPKNNGYQESDGWDIFPMPAPEMLPPPEILADGTHAPETLPPPEIPEPEALQHVQETATDLATLNQAAFVAALAEQAAEQEAALALVQKFEIQNQDDFTFLEEVLGEAKDLWKTVEERRTAFTKPANAILREFNSWFKPLQTSLKKIEVTTKRHLAQYRMAQEHEKQRLLAEARKAETPEIIRSTAIAAAEAVPITTSTQYIDNWVFEVTDPDAVPREFLTPDLPLIGKTVKSLKGKVKIPGVRVWNQQIVRKV